jgi:hypothetical protein
MRTKAEFEERWPQLMSDIPCKFTCPLGWTDLVWELMANIELELKGDFSQFDITQVKEKHGGLRFYYNFPNSAKHKSSDYIYQLAMRAEGESWGICLTCGTDADVTLAYADRAGNLKYGWLTSQCSPCRENFNPRTPRDA